MTKRKPPEEHLPAGAPTKWKPEINAAIVEFFAKGSATRFPTFERFATDNDLSKDTLHEWQKPENREKYPGFSDAYRKATEMQHSLVTEHAITGRYAPAFSIFFAKNNMGMSDDRSLKVSGTLGFYDILDDPGYAEQAGPE